MVYASLDTTDFSNISSQAQKWKDSMAQVENP